MAESPVPAICSACASFITGSRPAAYGIACNIQTLPFSGPAPQGVLIPPNPDNGQQKMMIHRSRMRHTVVSVEILRMASLPVHSMAGEWTRTTSPVDCLAALRMRIPRHAPGRRSAPMARPRIHRATRSPTHLPSSRGVAMLVNRFRGAVEARWVAERNSQCPSARSVGHAVVVRADTPDSLECRTQGERTPVADLASHCADRFPGVSKRISRQRKPPSGNLSVAYPNSTTYYAFQRRGTLDART